MAYTTGTAVGGASLLGALTTFMSSNGWTLLDTVAADDVVYSSSGTSSKFPMIMRLTLSSSANNPWKNCPYAPSKAEPCLFVRGYHTWSTGSHAGTGEYGIVGPLYVAGDESSGGTSPGTGFHAYRIDSSTGATGFPFQNNPDTGYLIPSTTFSIHHRLFDRTSVSPRPQTSSAAFYFQDIISGEVTTTFIPYGNGDRHACELVYDAATDKWFLYALSSSTTASDVFLKCDIETNTWSRVATVPWSTAGQGTQGGWLCWDGSDLIYIIANGSGTSLFYKYSISAGSFTILATLPSARSSSFYASSGVNTYSNYMYIPASVSGYSSDVILTALNTGVATLYCYNVTWNAWNDTTHGTPNVSLPYALNTSGSAAIVWDRQRYAYFSDRNNGAANANYLVYRMDLTNIAGGWTSLGFVTDGSYTGNSVYIWNAPVGKVRVQASPANSTYWIVGDSNHIILATKNLIGSGRYYWLYFGRIQSRRRASIMTTSSSVSPGTLVSIPVDDSSKYLAGDYAQIFDASTGNLEFITLSSVPDSTHVVATLTKSYTTGSFVGADPFQTVITGDSGLAVAPADPKGYKVDYESAWYKLLDYAGSGQIYTSTSDGMGYTQPIEAGMFLGYYSGSYLYTNQTNPLCRTGVLGSPYGIYFLPLQSYPAPQVEDVVRYDGNDYLLLAQSTYNPQHSPQRGVLIGPIS